MPAIFPPTTTEDWIFNGVTYRYDATEDRWYVVSSLASDQVVENLGELERGLGTTNDLIERELENRDTLLDLAADKNNDQDASIAELDQRVDAIASVVGAHESSMASRRPSPPVGRRRAPRRWRRGCRRVGRRVTRAAATASIRTRAAHQQAVVVARDLPQRIHGLAGARRCLRVRDPDHVGLVFRAGRVDFFWGEHFTPGLFELDDLGAVARRHVAVAQPEIAIHQNQMLVSG